MFGLALSLTQKVMLGTCLLGAVAGVVGSFAVLRRRALVGDMLAHAALPGLGLAFLIVGSRNFPLLLSGAFLTGIFGVALMTLLCRWTRTKEDAAIGIVLSTFFGAGIALRSVIARLPISGKAGLDAFLFGQAATMRNADLIVLTVTAVVCLLALAALYKEMKLFSFDPDYTRALGFPTLVLDLTMMGLLALVITAGLPAVGVVLMAALTILPGVTARFWTDRLERLLLLAAMVGGAMGAAGTYVSAMYRLPTGPVIVLCGTTFFLLSMLFAPGRGIVATAYASLKLRRRAAKENLLRTLYELNEIHLPRREPISLAQVQAQRSWHSAQLKRLLRQAARQGLVEFAGDQVRLTTRGLARAIEVTRAHRLWELYLIERANIAPDHVDRDADLVEHLLPPELVSTLEARLARLGQLPSRDGAIPSSPHGPGGGADIAEHGHG